MRKIKNPLDHASRHSTAQIVEKASEDLLKSPTRDPEKGGKVIGAKDSRAKIATTREEKFVRALMQGKNLVDAGRDAGFTSPHDPYVMQSAKKLLETPTVSELMNQAKDVALQKLGERVGKATVEYVESEFLSVYEEARSEGDRSNALRALESLGKYLGMFHEQKIGGDTYNTIIAATPELIDKEIERLAKAAGVRLIAMDEPVDVEPEN